MAKSKVRGSSEFESIPQRFTQRKRKENIICENGNDIRSQTHKPRKHNNNNAVSYNDYEVCNRCMFDHSHEPMKGY